MLRRTIPLLALLAAAPAFAAELPLKPGSWQITSTVRSMEMPGAPAGMMAKMIGKTTTMRQCITPAQAAAGPRQILKASEGKCRYNSFSVRGSKLDAVMVCTSGQGNMTSRMTGTVTATSYTMDQTMTAPSMKMTSAGTGKWLGPCK